VPRRVVQMVVPVCFFFLGVLMNVPVAGLPECSWPGSVKLGLAGSEVRHFQLGRLRQSRDFFRRHIPPGSRVLARNGGPAECLVICHDARVVLGRGEGRGSQRQADLEVMLSPLTALPDRLALLRRYNVTAFLVDDRTESISGWTDRVASVSKSEPGPWPGGWTRLVVFSLSPDAGGDRREESPSPGREASAL